MSEQTGAATPQQQELLEDPPQNGLAGLKHWRHDLLAGFVVALVSLPLSSGIAIASGAPPIYGIISSIIAGLVFPFVQGSYVTISGPAAGLAPALMAIMVALGGAGTADTVGAGYPLLLVVIFAVGIAQIVMAKLGLARFAGVFPSSVVEGMLMAIGVLILVKALPIFLGVLDPGHPHGFLDYLRHIPGWISSSAQGPVIIGVVCLVIMFAAVSKPAQKIKLFRVVPPHIFAVLIGQIMGAAMGLHKVNPAFFIQVPANPFDGIQLPAFSLMYSSPNLWKAALIGAVTLTLIDGVESLATAQAIDRIDPFRRKSDPNRLLAAMGVSNVLSSLVGGLTVIPGGVKSKTCIEAGGRTLWANFVNACMLLVFLLVAPTLIGLIPKATLGAILIYTGWKMAHPSIVTHLAKVGREQAALCILTIVITLLTDLLVGVLAGTVAKLILLAIYASRVTGGEGEASFGETVKGFFLDPVTQSEVKDGVATLELGRPLVCFNGYRLHERLAGLGDDIHTVRLNLTKETALVDHTACDGLISTIESCHSRTMELHNLEKMRGVSESRSSMHLRDRERWARAASLKPAAAAMAMSAGLVLGGEAMNGESEPDPRDEQLMQIDL